MCVNTTLVQLGVTAQTFAKRLTVQTERTLAVQTERQQQSGRSHKAKLCNCTVYIHVLKSMVTQRFKGPLMREVEQMQKIYMVCWISGKLQLLLMLHIYICI